VSNAEKFKQMSRGLDPAQAIAEADRCLLCHDAPCSEACPADTKPAEFIRKLRFKNVSGAKREFKSSACRKSFTDLISAPNRTSSGTPLPKKFRGRRSNDWPNMPKSIRW